MQFAILNAEYYNKIEYHNDKNFQNHIEKFVIMVFFLKLHFDM